MDGWSKVTGLGSGLGGFKDLVNAGVDAAQNAASTAREFDRNVRGTITTQELLDQIEKQEQELFTYKKRTRDLVTNFKALADEKRKLQETVQALSAAPVVENDDDEEEDEEEEDENGENGENRENEASGDNQEKIRKKVRKLRKLGQKKIGQKKIGMKKVEILKPAKVENKSENGWDNDEDDVELTKSENSDPKSENPPDSEYESEYASEYESEYESYYSDESVNSEHEKASTDQTPKTPKTPRTPKTQKTQKTQKTVDTGQIQILTRQLAEALQQNDKQGETFKTDRKIMKADHEQKLLVVNQELSDTKERLEQTDNQLSAIKDQVRESTVLNQKEKDAADKNRRDTQHQIFKYRQKIENLEIQLDREKDARGRAEFDADKEKAGGATNNILLNKYQTEVTELKNRLVLAEEKLAQPDTTNLTKIKSLQEELQFKTKQHSEQTDIWNKRTTEQTSRIKHIEKSEENRRSVLEQQIHELSASIGRVEKQKLKDTEVISDLRNRMSQQDLEILELENKSKSSKDIKYEELPKFMADVVERTHGKSQAFSSLLVACRKAINEDVSIGILGQVFPEVKTAFEKQISALQDEVGNLQREITDNDKRDNDNRRESLPPTTSPKHQAPVSTKLEEQLKAHILQLQTQLSDLKSHISSLELKQKNKESELQNNFNTQTKEKDQSWQSRIHELEVELINHRERSLKTLSDKDREVQQLRAAFNSPPMSPEAGYNQNHEQKRDQEEQNSNNSSSFYRQGELEEKLDGGGSNSVSNMHYSEKLARKDIELDTLKKQNKECVKRIRQLQEKNMGQEASHESVIQEFKDRIAVAINPVRKEREKESNKHQDYIKNVLFNFLIMPKNSTGRTQTLQALAASLGFTNEELNKVRSVQKL